jgi:hypothetical protein
MPLTFADKEDYAGIARGDLLELDAKGLKKTLRVKNVTRNLEIPVALVLSDHERVVLEAGGKLAFVNRRPAG